MNTRFHKLARMHKALSEVNRAIVRMSDEDELFPLVCRVVVNCGCVNMAWIGVASPEAKTITPVTSFGTGNVCLESLDFPPIQDKPIVVNDWAENPLTSPRKEQASDHQWGSGGYFPVLRGGQLYAVLSVNHEAKDFFDREVTTLLAEMTRDISFALDHFDRERARCDAMNALHFNEQHFRAYFERTMFGMAASSPDKGWIEVNPALCEMLGYEEEELLASGWGDLVHPEDLETGQAQYQQLVSGEVDELSVERRFIQKSGNIIDTHVSLRAVRNADGSFAYVVSLVEDISSRKMAERRDAMRRDTLEKVARGRPLAEVMAQAIESMELIYPESKCSILLMDEDGKHLHKGAAPSLPVFFNEATDGIEIGIGVGSCGTAAFTGVRVVVEDISSHPYWEAYKDLASKAGLRACWSEPIRSSSGTILGSFAIYRGKPGAPGDQEIALIESAANLVGIAIERLKAQESLQLASSIYNNSAEAILVTDASNKISALNPAFTKITGYTLEAIRGKDISLLSVGTQSLKLFHSILREVDLHGTWQGEAWCRRKNGETFPAWLTVSIVRDKKGVIQHHIITGSDITEKVRTGELVWRQANYDFLTELPNRHMFKDRLEQEIRAAINQDTLLGLLFIDLDHFKDVNDSLGHSTGDQLLIEAAERISQCARSSDTVARMGGDEFTVILPRLENTIDAERVAEQIVSTLAEPYSISGQTIYAHASVGITFCPNDATDAEQLISNADQAMYASKTAGRNRLSYFTQSLHDEAQNRLKLINDMRTAAQAGQFELYFQPIINLATGGVYKAEALIRWNHPELGMVSPAEFIPLAEETGLIVGIGDWVFRKAAVHAKRWRELFDKGLQVSVNMSPIQFQNSSLSIPDWLEYLLTLGLEAEHLCIEITEGLLLNASDDIKNKLLQFRDAGVQVAIDDFGVGYSALSYLKRFDIDYLKIDQSFIHNLETDQNDLVLSEAIAVMAHRLGLKVVAEGVETEAQRQLLLEIGCDYGQGYHFSRPLPADEFEAFLARATRPDGAAL